MIAALSLEFAGERVNATMLDNGEWQCVHPVLSIVLNAVHNPNDDYGPWAGAFGEGEVDQVIERYAGRVLWRRKLDGVPRVY